jgi:prepilin-type N-terminal cleavage/methylation domain-containing protein
VWHYYCLVRRLACSVLVPGSVQNQTTGDPSRSLRGGSFGKVAAKEAISKSGIGSADLPCWHGVVTRGFQLNMVRPGRNMKKYQVSSRQFLSQAGLTLMEVVVALMISGLAVAAIVTGYIFSVASAQKTALSLAAGAKAMERIEQTRSAKWDISKWPQVDQLDVSNFPNEIVVLDENAAGNGITYGTNITQISQISQQPPLKMVHVDCVWNFKGIQLLTNSVETCRAPDQ